MSSELAQWYHSINIGDANTWDDWHIVPASRPLIASPQVKTSFVSLPGGDGGLDLTEVLAGRPTYERRIGSWEFVVMNDYGDWATRYSDIMAYLQGKEYRIIFDDDPNYYYLGRLSVNEWRSEPYYSRIVIDYNVEPYKYNVDGFGSNWLWDPFNFETGVIQDYRRMIVDGSLSLTYINDSLISTTPTITSSVNNMKMTFNDTRYNLVKGPNVFANVVFQPGDNPILFQGNGIVSIESIGGRL